MKRVNLLKKMFVLVAFLALAGVGWAMVEEENVPSISSELHTTRSGVPVVYGITSVKGNAGGINVQVKYEIISSEGLDLAKSTFAYYEPNQGTPGWVDAKLEEGKTFTFGPAEGFPLQDATSYFKLIPAGTGKLVSKMSVINVAEPHNVVVTKVDELIVTADAKNISIKNGEETTYYASLYTAVRFAKENDVINVPTGDYDLRRGTEAITEGSNETGWYLPINKKGITIKGESREGVKITSSVFASNTAWSTQNLVTVFADNVTLENLTFICKKETNKVIEVVGKDVKLKNITCNPPSGENFAGSIYFNIADLGTAALNNLQLNSGRITFSGATNGTVNMSDINIDYTNVKIDGNSMEQLAAYDPIGSTTGKSGLTINAEKVTVKVAANSDAYTLSANTIKNLPANATLHLAEGTYEVGQQLVINKPINLEGAAAENVILKAATAWEGNENSQKNLVSIEGNGTGVATLANITIQEAKRSGLNAQSAMTLKLNNVTLKNNIGAGMVVHSAVEATGLKTEGNKWGGVNLDAGKPSYPISFKFDETSAFAEDIKIYADNKELDMTVTYPENQGWYTYDIQEMRIWSNLTLTVAPTIDNSTLIASTIEAGQTLSASVLSGKATVDGKEIAGTFAWKDPKAVATEDKQAYEVVFTPNDLSTYSVAKTEYTFSGKNAIKQYYTITTGKCENGRVEIKEANAANRYLKGSKLTLLYHPDANYKTKADAETRLSVTEDKVLTTTFDAIMHMVTIAVGDNGKVSVNGKEYTENSTTISVQQGSELTVQAIPTGDYVGALACSDSKVISNGVVTVDKPFTITASFTAKPANEYVVSVPAVENGKILLYDKDGNAINAGTSVETGTEVSVLAVPDLGYKLTSEGIKNNDTSITDGKITVSAAASITATFEKQTFAVTKTEQNATIAITGYESLNQVPYGTELTANVTPNDNYKLLSLVVNGKEIANGGTFTVTAATEVKAVMRKLATIVIDKTPQTFVYDGNTKEFVVKTIPAGIGGFTVNYDATPKDAADHTQKAYKVTITRPADDVYAAVSQEIKDGLVILATDVKGVAIPTASGGSLNTNQNADLGSYAWEGGSGVGDQPIHNAIFTPKSGNYKKVTFSILTGNGQTPAEVTLDWYGLQTRSTTPNVKFNVNGGSLTALNGSASLSSGSTLYAGQKIRLVATPDATHAAKVTWSVTGATLNDQTDTEAILTLTENTVVTATFATKSSPVFPGLEGLDKAVYDGTIYGTGTPTIKEGTVRDNWSITFKQDGVATSTPINAGTYDIYVSRPADAIYSAVIDQKVGSFTIAQKQVTANVTAATPVLKGQSLAQSVLSGTADVDGSFVWLDPTVLMTATGNQKAKFVPANANYKESGELTANVTVNEATGVTLRTLNVNITNPEKGTVTMTLNGSEVVAGASVTKDDKLIVTYAATAANYKASATIGGNAYNSGTEYTVPESGDVEVAVSFVYNNPNPGTDTDPDPSTVDVTGVTLEPTSQTLGVNEILALKATVAPADATDKGISWSSSAPDIASVDTKGNVKALKAGTATITATTNDGGFTATCKITVSVPTGIEDILSGTRVYAQDGSIVLEPTVTLQVFVSDMTGRVIWQGKLSEKKQIAVSAGVYIVRLSNANGVQTQKLIVQ